MQCITPMFRRYELGNHAKGQIVPRSEVLDKLNYDPTYISESLKKINGRSLKIQYEKIPCGKCWACQLNYSAEWATRIECECKKDDHNYFITFTYDNDHLPENGSLKPEHITTFIKSLRKHYERKGIKGIKYFYCGEYGSTTGRPHYHMILMHCPLNLNEFYDTHIDTNFQEHWKSKEINKWWDKGITDIAAATWSTAAYVARYCTKKIGTDQSQYEALGRKPEFIRMSNGIGDSYYQENKEKIYEHDEIIMKTVKGNTGSYKPPKAWDKKYKEENPGHFREIQKERRKAAERSSKLSETLSDYNDVDKIIQNAQKIKIKMNMLPREAVD